MSRPKKKPQDKRTKRLKKRIKRVDKAIKGNVKGTSKELLFSGRLAKERKTAAQDTLRQIRTKRRKKKAKIRSGKAGVARRDATKIRGKKKK